MPRTNLWPGAIAGLLAIVGTASGCGSDVVVTDGPATGPGGGTGAGGATGSGGGAAGGATAGSCRELVAVGQPFVVGQDHNLQFDVGMAVDGTVVLTQRDDHTMFVHWVTPWGAWPPPAPSIDTVSGAFARVAPGVGAGASLISSDQDKASLYVDALPGQWPPAIGLDFYDVESLTRVDGGYVGSFVGQFDFRYRFVGLSPAGATQWQEAPVGCGKKADFYGSVTPVVRAAADGRLLALFGVDPANVDCKGAAQAQTRLYAGIVGPTESLQPTLLEEADTGMASLAVLPVTGSTDFQVVYSRFDGAATSQLRHLRVSVDGTLVEPPTAFDIEGIVIRPPDAASLPNGFVIALTHLPNPADQGRISLLRYDDTATLLSELETEVIGPVPPAGVRLLTSPDGRSVLAAWLQQAVVSDQVGKAEMLRFDCVDD